MVLKKGGTGKLSNVLSGTSIQSTYSFIKGTPKSFSGMQAGKWKQSVILVCPSYVNSACYKYYV